MFPMSLYMLLSLHVRLPHLPRLVRRAHGLDPGRTHLQSFRRGDTHETPIDPPPNHGEYGPRLSHACESNETTTIIHSALSDPGGGRH